MWRLLKRAQHFFAELRRRNVYQVAVTYAVVAFVVIQVADLTFVRLGFPPWTVTFIIVLSALGFPLAVVLAWAFEMTPEGVIRTEELDQGAGGDVGSASEPGPAPEPGRRARDEPGASDREAAEASARDAGEAAARKGTVQVERPPPGTCEMLPARLEVVAGDPEVEEVRFFDPGQGGRPEFTFGRRRDSSMTHVRLENPTVSREHATISFGPDGATIENLSTTNPTQVNENPLEAKGASSELEDGDLIDMGQLRFRYREG